MRPQEARFIVRCTDLATGRALRRAIEVESWGAAGGNRIQVAEVPEDPSSFVVSIEADAFGNLRAATSSLLNWLRAADGALDAADPGH